MARRLKQIRTLEDLKDYPQSIGPRITIAREHAGMSVEDLAARLGVTSASVDAWEGDERTPRANRLTMMAGILDVSLMWLLEGREDERMRSGDVLSAAELRGRVELARGLITRGLEMLESIEKALDTLAQNEAEEDADASELED